MFHYHLLGFGLTFLLGICYGQESGWAPNQVNATMCAWFAPRAAVIRDTVYIDGGYLMWEPGLSDGTYGLPTQDGNPLGLIYLLNFSTPFTTSQNFSDVFTTISKAGNGGAANNIGPQYYDGAMFANDGEWYTYGGLLSLTEPYTPPPASQVLGYESYQYGEAPRRFFQGFLTEDLPSNMTRYVTDGGAVSIPSQNQGFYFGGLRAANYGPIYYPSGNETLNADVLSNTLISVNMSVQGSETWQNTTLPSVVPGRANPELVWIPVSTSGVLIAIGGVINPVYDNANQSLDDAQKYQSSNQSPHFMETVAVYDIDKQEWYMQDTSGTPPGQLTQGCTVVASAIDGSSHNIYWYGGFDGIDPTQTFSDDVWILSVPSFMWTKASNGTATHGRASHKCVKPYPDQMLVIGGYSSESGDIPICVEQSIVQVYNLSSAEWMTSYDPIKWTDYQVPDIITAKIGGNGTGGATKTSPSSWANDSLGSIFGAPYSGKIKNWYPYQLAKPTQSNAPTSTSTPHPHSSGLPSYFGPLVGVLLGLAAVGIFILCFILWRRRKYLKTHGSESGTVSSNYRIMSWIKGTPTDHKAPTVSTDDTGPGPASPEPTTPPLGFVAEMQELPVTQVHELPGTSRPQELQATGMSEIPNRRALKAQPSDASGTSGTSRISGNSSGSRRPIFSAFQREGTPRPESPSLGGAIPESRVASDVPSFTHSHGRQISDVGSLDSNSSTGHSRAVSPPAAESSRAVSPPTPVGGREASDYLSTPKASASTNRKSQFGEMLED